MSDDLLQQLRRFQEESGLSWSELARRVGVYHHTVWSWKEGLVLPSRQYRRVLLELATSMGGLDRLFIV